MKSNTFLLLLIWFLSITSQLFAGHIAPEVAGEVAKNFYSKQAHEHNPSGLVATLAETKTRDGQSLIYIFNINDEGFVLVSGWDGVAPVAGYADSGIFPAEEENQPEAFMAMLDVFAKQIEDAIAKDVKPTPEVAAAWESLLDPAIQSDGSRSVNPLLNTTWNQSCYYNELCPEDDDSPNGYCGHVPAGCVALAMAQVMKYWDYPATGSGSHTYYASPYGWQSADFGNTTYDWDNMTGSVYSTNTAVATLIYHCAVGVNMQFAPDGSGAYTSDAISALENYFNYDPQGQYYNKDSYTDEVWESMLRDELDLGRPMIYRGQGSGGHAWVCDGYAADDYFHMNWGWGGYANGYFYLSNLNPAGQTFTYYQGAIMQIFPGETSVDPPRNLEAEVNGAHIELSWDEPFASQWIHWDDGSTGGTLSLVGGGSFEAAARWAPADLTAFDGLYINKVSVFLGTCLASYEVNIRTGEDAGNLVLNQPVSSMVENSWNLVDLNEAIRIDASEELYVGVKVIDQPNGESALGYDNGPANVGYGDLISFNGVSWTNLSDYGMDVNWNIQALVTTGPDGKNTATATLKQNTFSPAPTKQLVSVPVKQGAQTTSPNTRNLMGYNVYRDGAMINESVVSELAYTDEDVQPGNYAYYVTSVYSTGESEPSNTVNVTSGLATQTFQLAAGWNGISSIYVPLDPDLDTICKPVADNLAMLQTLVGQYCPGMNINTLQNWSAESGYFIKVTQPCSLPFAGLASTNLTITLEEGWNLIPVLSACEVNTEDLFAGIVNHIRIVKDAAGSGVYWPEKNVNTLPVLEPGKAYMVKISTSEAVTFPSCE